MAVVQDAYDIPLDIMTKMLTGEYRRIGSVVRYAVGPNKGQIVKHLKPVKLEVAEQTKGIGAKALQFAKNNKRTLVVAGIGAGVAAAGAGVYYKNKTKETRVVTEFRAALKAYIDAIRKGKLDIEIINNLMNILEELKKNKVYEKISIQLTTEELEVLVNRIYEYTIKLANDNSVELSDEELTVEKDKGTIINLLSYLKAQKRIFETAA